MTFQSISRCFTRRRNSKQGANLCRRAIRGVERLEERRLLAVTASFSPAGGLLQVVGDNADNNIEIARAANGQILVNDGEVAIVGGTPTVGNTNVILASGLDGNDSIILNEALGALPEATLLGGDGNDTLIGGAGTDTILGGADNDFIRGAGNEDRLFGGSGNDTILGDRGNDSIQGQSGFDLLIWNNGDGSDLMEGGDDLDVIQVNGADGADDDFSVDPNGDRVRFQRNNLGLFQLDIGTMEDLDINGQGGDDTIAGSVGLAGLIELDIDGGEGNDVLIGSDGVDTLRGGAGNDTLIGGRGNDVKLGEQGDDLFVWNNGDGSDLMEGGDDLDVVQVNGADGADDDFSVDPNGDRVRFQRNNLGLFQLDIGTTEDLDINGQGGDDTIAGRVGLAGLIELDIDGGEGNDLLIGSDGVDTLRGGAGNDTLEGGPGNDVLLGEDDDDRYVFSGTPDSDLVATFTAGVGVGDVIALLGFGPSLDSFSDVLNAATPNGNDTRINLDSGILTLNNVLIGSLVEDDFQFDVTDADFDSDGDVDGADFLRQQRGFGTLEPNASKADGDADGDLDVDGDDVAAWEATFGQASASSASARKSVAAPTRPQLIDAALAYNLLRLSNPRPASAPSLPIVDEQPARALPTAANAALRPSWYAPARSGLLQAPTSDSQENKSVEESSVSSSDVRDAIFGDLANAASGFGN